MKNRVKNYFKRFVREEDGGELVEYAIVIAIVAVLAAAVLGIVSVVKQKVADAGAQIGNINPGSVSGTAGGGATTPTIGGGVGGNP